MLDLEGDAALASFLWMLVCVVLIIGLAYWFTKYVAGRGALGAFSAGRRMEVLDRLLEHLTSYRQALAAGDADTLADKLAFSAARKRQMDLPGPDLLG